MDRSIAACAEVQHGVIDGRQLAALGLTQDDIDYRVRVGRLLRLHRGVFAVGHACLTNEAEFCAAVLAVGDEAFADGPSALALWDLRERRDREPVYLLSGRRVRPPRSVRVRWAAEIRPADTSRRREIPVLMPAPALLASASVLGARDLRRAVNEALVQKRASVPALVDLIARNRGRRGIARLAATLLDARPTRSEFEDAAVAFLLAYDFDEFETNAWVGPDEVDVLWSAERLVLELDGSEFHDNPLARADDAAKDGRLRTAGYHVIRLRWRDVTARQTITAARLRGALRVHRNPEQFRLS